MKKNLITFELLNISSSSKQENSKQIVVFWKMVTLDLEATCLSESADWNSGRKSNRLLLIFHIVIVHLFRTNRIVF